MGTSFTQQKVLIHPLQKKRKSPVFNVCYKEALHANLTSYVKLKRVITSWSLVSFQLLFRHIFLKLCEPP